MTIHDALSPLGVPVQHSPYRGAANKYITYTLLGQSTTLYAEGQEAETSVQYAVNLYLPCAENYRPFLLSVKETLEAAGYVVTVETEYYEDAVALRHIVLMASVEGAEYG